jgi:GYF domain 2/Domain of unknown function (DUF4190)
MAGEGASEGWYVRARGRVQGPLTWAQLLALRERGQLARFDQLSRDRQTWSPADSVDGLFPRGATAGAFVGPGTAKGHARNRGPESESVGFLILDDDEPARPPAAGGVDPAAAPADEPMGWYYADGGLPQGPVGFSDLKGLARDGRIGPGTLFWRSGLEQWTTGSEIPDLKPLWRHEATSGPDAGGVNLPPRARGAEPAQAQSGAAWRINPLAILSLALNLFCGVGNLAAIVVGVVALRQVARSNGMQSGKGLAVAGIVLGHLGLAIAALMFFWFFPRGPR